MQNQDIQKFNSNGVMSAVTVFNQVAYLSGQVPKITTPDIYRLTNERCAEYDRRSFGSSRHR